MTTPVRAWWPGPLWRSVFVFLITVQIWQLAIHGPSLFLGEEYSRAAHAVRAVLTAALAVGLVVFARRFVDRRPWDGLGLPSPRAGWRSLLLGAAAWLVPAGIGIAACVALGWTEITPRAPAGEVALMAAALPVLVLLYEALPEELIFRGYLYTNLAAALPRWLAVVAQAVLFTSFGVVIGSAGSLERVILFFSFALVLGYLRVVTGDIWAGIGFHLAFQTVAQALGDSQALFAVSDPDTLEPVAYVLLPFTLGIWAVRAVRPAPPGWRDREPQPDPAIPGACP